MPLLTPRSLRALLDAQGPPAERGTALLTAHLDDPGMYGRILRGSDGAFRGIVEAKDASAEERAIDEVNLGVYAFPGADLLEALPRLSNDNAQGEYYVTDVLGMLAGAGLPVRPVALEDPREARGVNTIAELAEARGVLQERILAEHMAAGVLIEDPATTFIQHGVTIGAGTHVLPCTYIHAGVVIGEGCEVGPFTQLREGTVLEDGAEVGNFTECKKSRIGRGAKAKHLTYLGDTEVGAGANIGAGTIFANYDGSAKHKSVVGEGAFIGSGTIIVAPNTVADGATTGAGAVLTRGSKVGPGETWIGVPAKKHERRKD